MRHTLKTHVPVHLRDSVQKQRKPPMKINTAPPLYRNVSNFFLLPQLIVLLMNFRYAIGKLCMLFGNTLSVRIIW